MMPVTPEDYDLLAANPAFAAIQQRIASMIEDHRNALESDVREEATWKARGACAALRMVLVLPELMKDEAEREKKAKR